MVFIKLKNRSIHLSKKYYTDNNNKYKIGLESIFIKGLNWINIKTDCKIQILNKFIDIKKGEYSITELNKLFKPVVLSYVNKKIEIESPCYYILDEKLKEYLGFQKITNDLSFPINNKSMYVPTSNEKYIYIEKECKITINKDNDKNSNKIDLRIIPIGIYSIDELESIVNVDKNDNFITITINEKNEINIDTNNYDYIVDSYLLAPMQLYTQGFFKNFNGIITSRSNDIKTKIKGNYSIEQLNSKLPPGIKLQNDKNCIILTSKTDFLMDENFKLSLGIENMYYLYKNIGEVLNNINNINNRLLDVHCNIIEKSLSFDNNIHTEEDLLYSFYYDYDNPYIKINPIKYIPVKSHFQTIEIDIIDQNGKKYVFDDGDFIVYLDLIQE